MKTSEINSLIKELDDKINYWAENRYLFCGGCCYTAYLVAKGFEKLGIRYTTVVYQGGDTWNTNRFNIVCNGSGCGHIAIRVVYKHKKMMIGSSKSINGKLIKFMNWEGAWMMREYSNITSDILKDAYYSNEWNWRWDVMCNGVLSREINKIFNKYI